MIDPTLYLRQIMAETGGSISLERFMQEALYHPACGYYAARVRRIGSRGDFSTGATLHPAIGIAVAQWALAYRREVRARSALHFIELGGGSGDFATSMLSALGWLRRGAWTYHIVEVSPRLRAAQRVRLGRLARRVHWHDDIASALQAAGGHALIFSNEFVDAFACVQLLRDPAGEQWREVRLYWPAGAEGPQETFGPWPREGDPVVRCSGLVVDFPPGQRIELHLSFRRWLESWRHLWLTGRMLTIDYGDEISRLYERRLQGTLRAYCHHQRFNGSEVYARFGQQDLTADVNFTDLQNWGEELRLENAGLATQCAFLEKWLPRRWLRRVSADPRLAFLMYEDGAGNAFKVLEQRPVL